MNGGDDEFRLKPDEPAAGPPAGEARHGGVRHDSRGNAVWEWAVETGRQALDSTSRLLKRLEVPGLKLEDTGSSPKPPQADPAAPAGPAARGKAAAPAEPAGRGRPDASAERTRGYDPYGGARGGAGRTRTAAAPTATGKSPAATARGAPTKPAAAASTRPSLWRRLFRRG